MARDLLAGAQTYFEAFSRHDLKGLGAMFSDKVTLTDWDIVKHGKDAVLDANKSIFDSFPLIKIRFERAYISGRSVASEIVIHLDSSTSFGVVDVLDFDDDGLIVSVRAYKGHAVI